MLLSGKEIRPVLEKEIRARLSDTHIKFYLYSDKDDFACQAYLKSIKKMLASFEVPFEEGYIDKAKTEEENIAQFCKEKEGKSVLIARPLNVSYENKLIDTIESRYDPDMLTEVNRGKLFSGNLTYLPATAQSVRNILKYYNIDVKGKKCVVIGRSISVGLPCFELLNISGGAVTVLHSKISKEDMEDVVRQADIIVFATGKSGLIDRSVFNSKQIVIDCGYNPHGGDLGFVPEENELLSYTPVPGGVGSLTSYCLLLNAINLL